MTEQNSTIERSDLPVALRVLIVDDEPVARASLAWLCERRADVAVVAQATSGTDAIVAIRAHRPDLVLLDLELRDMSGFDVLRSVPAPEQPRAIMIAAHAEHALAAFENDAIDYLTKPIDVNRFNHAIERARARCSTTAPRFPRVSAAALCAALSAVVKESTKLRLPAERAHRLYFIETTDIEYIESAGNYVNIHTGHGQYITRRTLQGLAEMLRPVGFVRIERSLLVNLRSVSFAERIGAGRYQFILRSGKRLVSSASHRTAILGETRRKSSV